MHNYHRKKCAFSLKRDLQAGDFVSSLFFLFGWAVNRRGDYKRGGKGINVFRSSPVFVTEGSLIGLPRDPSSLSPGWFLATDKQGFSVGWPSPILTGPLPAQPSQTGML